MILSEVSYPENDEGFFGASVIEVPRPRITLPHREERFFSAGDIFIEHGGDF